MRKTFLDIDDYPTKEDAEAECPWACAVEPAEGSRACFESATDWELWTKELIPMD